MCCGRLTSQLDVPQGTLKNLLVYTMQEFVPEEKKDYGKLFVSKIRRQRYNEWRKFGSITNNWRSKENQIVVGEEFLY